MTDLLKQACQPCQANARPVDDQALPAYLAQLPGWRLHTRDDVNQLEKAYAFKDFACALAFTNAVGALAEAQDHHPALLTEWGQVTVTWWTHAIKGLHENDFILAARTEALAQQASGRK